MLNRIDSPIGPENIRTFQILAPVSTHFRPATCAEADCPDHIRGWITVLELGDDRAEYVRRSSGRSFVETRDATHVTFTFKAGQTCFRPHRIRVDRPEIFIARDGDYRGNPRGTEPYRHKRAVDWADEFAENQDRIITAHERG